MERTIKIITLGPSGVGKTSIINRIVNNDFKTYENNTINFQFNLKTIDYEKKNMKLKLNYIDTAGQELYQNILPKNYIRDSLIVLLVFDNLDNLEILEKRWYKFYKENANVKESKFILVANKSDEFGVNRENIKELGNKFADKIDAFFITCSAKSNDNIDNLENIIIKEIKRLIEEEDKEKFKTDDKNTNNSFSTSYSKDKIILGKTEKKKACFLCC